MDRRTFFRVLVIAPVSAVVAAKLPAQAESAKTTFKSSGTWNKPAGCKMVRVTVGRGGVGGYASFSSHDIEVQDYY